MIKESWKAKWIWASGYSSDNNVYVEARKAFEVTLPVTSAVARISANQSYKLFINGIEVGRGPAPSDLLWMTFDTYDISGYLNDGTNVVAVTAHNFGTDRIVTNQLQGPGGLICQLDLYESVSDVEDETRAQIIASSSDWKCRRSPRWREEVSRLHMWGGYREIIDMSKDDGWEQIRYDDSLWPNAVSIADAEQPDSPWPRLIAREIPYLKQTLVAPVAVVSAEPYKGAISGSDSVVYSGKDKAELSMDASIPGSIPQITFDFGAEVVGYPEIEVVAEEGGVLQLFYGESLEMSLMDTYLLRKGINKLTPFGRRAFRYLKVSVMATPVPIQVHNLLMRFVHYPYNEEGYFRCSDEKLNRIWETGRYTTIVNSQNHFEDCPYREGALWVADSVVMAKVVYQTLSDPSLVRKSLLQAARIQNEDGSIPGTGPQQNSFLLPDFCAHWLFGISEYYAFTKDTAFLKEVWPNITKLAGWFKNQEDEAGLFAKADRDGMWCFIDWSDDIERKDRVTAISCFYYKFLMTASFLAKELGEQEEHINFQQKAIKLRGTIRDLLRIPQTSIYADCMTDQGLSSSITAQTNFAAAWSGIMDKTEAAEFIQNHYLSGRLPSIRGAFFYHIVLETLFANGYSEEAIVLIRKYWGDMLDRGATTWWETFDPDLPFSTIPSPYMGHTPTYLQDAIPVSLCHGWGASPTYLLSKELLGIDVSTSGIGAVSLNPTIVEGIEWAEGSVILQQGEIRAEWKRDQSGVCRFQASFPKGISWVAPGISELSVVTEEERIQVEGIIASSSNRGAAFSESQG
ncbi:alpha-L-rhamnosidase-related protein [Paenibacillus dakarensis]|uniref:alpha-L-rhamnosidase-related protein n=1 Tax=Paenibacillus dakarensis TaxID=1527293 RepID=UPI0009E8B293|nr:alpha-L-rhamnosidase N-terminal domain-containing protein [Paenibacillus dakarensis]